MVTPGSLPSEASVLKQILQIPAFLINALGLPHKGHLLYARTLNFGFLCAFAIKAFLAKLSSLRSLVFKGHSHEFQEFFPFFIGLGCGYNRNIQTLDGVNLVIVDLRENDVLGDAEAVIAASIKGFS